MSKCHAIGNQGNWFARIEAPKHPEIDGKDLPCIWDYFAIGGNRYDSDFDLSKPKFQALAQGIKDTGHVVMRKRDMETSDDEFRSAGYVAVFKVANVKIGERLTFDFVERICDLNR